MSVAEVQARTSEIHALLERLRVPTQTMTTPAAAPASDSASFSRVLAGRQAVLSASPVSTAATSSAIGTGTGTGTATGQRVVDLASAQMGTPYVWGGNEPGGFDCSGLVQWTYGQLGVDLPRVSTDQAKAGREVSAAETQPGDLVFFERGKVDHIGIYAGDGKWVVAPKTGDVVKMQDVDLSKATTIRRVVDSPAAPSSTSTGAWASALPAAGRPYASLIASAAQQTGVDPALLSAVAWSESGFNASATSPVGAQGLMQLMPRTAAGLGVDALDPASALTGGGTYLAQQLKAFDGRTDLALAAYNAGPTAVRKHGGVPPYVETQSYVSTVLSRYRALGGTA